MGFKNMKANLTFSLSLSLSNAIEKNSAIKRMEQINRAVNWSKIESLMLRHYPVSKSFEGNDSYPVFLGM